MLTIRAPSLSRGKRELDERERREHVHLVDAPQLLERVVGERRQRARAEDAGVVDEQVDRLPAASTSARRCVGIGDVAAERDDAVEAGRRALERVAVARVDDEPPAALGESAGEREPEARETRR